MAGIIGCAHEDTPYDSITTVTHPAGPAPPARPPLSILRTETVLSRFPIHNLTKHGRVTIHIPQTNAQGEFDLRWTVSYNENYGHPRPLAYKLDTVVINQLLDTLPRPLPCVLHVGSLTQMGRLLGPAVSGRQQAQLKNAFHQNASAYIVAYLRYRGRDGTVRTVNRGFTRYSVVFTGERLPDDTAADGIYLVLNETYREVLNQAPVRPLDYAYLKALPPMAQRFYELLSYKMFATLKHRRPRATLRYTDYCLLATQQRYTEAIPMQKQMYKVHRPHVASGYLTTVQYEATTDADGGPDWLMHYTPGPKARDRICRLHAAVWPRRGRARLSPGGGRPGGTASPPWSGSVRRRVPLHHPQPARGPETRQPRPPARRSHRPARAWTCSLRRPRTRWWPRRRRSWPPSISAFMAVPRARRIPKNWRTPRSS